MKRIAPIRVISFVLLTACWALCQSESPSVDLAKPYSSDSLEVQRQEMRTWRSLPDAPPVQTPRQAAKFQTFVDNARSSLTLDAVDVNLGIVSKTGLGHITPGLQPSFTTFYKLMPTQRESGSFLGKYLYLPLRKQNLRYHPSTSGSFMGRASDAASRIFITREDSGKRRLNTTYFLGVLSSVAAHNASRPYWMRSATAPFNDFGSTVGNDAGINLFHEFGPGIRQIVKGHMPRFVFEIQERITRNQHPREVVSSPE